MLAPDRESRPSPPRRRFRRRAIALAVLAVLVLTLGLGLLVVRARLDGWARGFLEARLAELLGGPVVVEQVQLHVRELWIDVRGLRVEVPAEQATPFVAELARARVRLGVSGLAALLQGRFRVEELLVERPELRVSRDFLDARKGSRRRPVPLELRIDRLVLRDGTAFYEDREIPLEFEARDVALDGEWSASRRAMLGRVRGASTVARSPLARPLPVALDGQFRWAGSTLELLDTALAGPGMRATAEATVSWGDGFRLEGGGKLTATLAELQTWLETGFPAIEGQVEGEFGVEAGPTPLRFTARLRGSGARFDRLEASRIEADVDLAEGRLALRGLDAAAYGGRVRGEVQVDLSQPTRFRTELEGDGLALDRLFRLVGVPLPFAGRTRAEIELAGAAGAIATWEGTVRARAEPVRQAELVPARAAAEVHLADGHLRATAAGVQAGAATFDVDVGLTLAPTGTRGTVALRGTTASAGDTRAATVRILRALEVRPPDLLELPLAGRGALATTIGIGDGAAVEVELALEAGAWSEQPFDLAELRLVLRGDALTLERLRVLHGAAQIEGTLTADVARGLLRHVDVRARELPLARLLGAVIGGEALAAEGTLSGALRLQREGESGGLAGGGELILQDLLWSGIALGEVSSIVQVQDDVFRFPRLVALGPAVEVRGSLELDTRHRTADVRIAEGAVELAELSLLRERGVPASGRVDVEGNVRWDGDDISGSLRVAAAELELVGRRLGPVAGTIGLALGEAEIALRSDGSEDWRVVGTLGLDEELPLQAMVELREAVLEWVGPQAVEMWSRSTGTVHVGGPLARPEEVAVRARLEQAELHLGGRTLRTEQPLDLVFDGGELRAGPARVVGQGTSLDVRLRWVPADGGLELSANGELDVGVLAAPVEQWRASGTVRTELEVRGTTTDPLLRGRLELRGGRLRLLGFPHTLEQTSADVVLEGSRAELRRFEAVLGGGPLRGTGEATFDGLTIGAYRASLEGNRVRVNYPDGFRGVYDGTLTLQGDATRARLAGELEMLRGTYVREFDLAQLLGRGVRDYEATEAPALPENVELHVDLRARDGLWVRNETASVEARLELSLRGDLNRPEVTGRVQLLEGGELRFRDVEYRITSGALDFVERDRLNPYLNIRAETRIKEYEIQLAVEGTLDRFEYRLTSTPPLSQQDIIAMLTTGRTLQELTAAGGGGSVFTGDLAKNYFAGALTDPFEKQLGKLLGLERVRIDPLLVRGQADPTTRVTLGKEVAEDLFLIGSTDLDSAEQQIYQIEWRASRNLRLTAERSATGALGGDVQFSRRLWLRRAEKAGRSADGEPGTPPPEPSPPSARRGLLERLEVEGIDAQDRREVQRRLPFREGAPFQRRMVVEGAEAIRRYFVATGRIQAVIESDVSPPTGDASRVSVTYRVTPGPTTRTEIRGVSAKDARRVRERLEAFWAEAIVDEELFRESADVIADYFRERGFYAVDVRVDEVEGEGTHDVIFTVDTGKPVRIERVSIEGAAALPEERIRDQMLSERGSLFGRRTLIPRVLQEDLVAIRNLYRDEGFLRVLVEEPRIGLSTDGGSAKITVRIQEGPRFTVGRIEYAGLPDPGGSPPAPPSLRAGQPFSPRRLLEAESEVRAELDRLGYPDARVRGEVELGESTADVRFDVEPGERKRVGAIEISGNRRSKPRIVRRELQLAPGDLISRERMLRTQHKLYNLGVFRSVRVEDEPLPGGAPGERLLHVRLEEERPVSLTLGAGYDSEAGPRGSFSLVNNNVGGWGRTLGLQGRVSDIERRAQLTAEEPRLFEELPTLVNLLTEFREQVSFSEKRRGAAVRVELPLDERWTAFTRYNFQRIDLTDVQDPVAVLEEKLENIQLGDLSFAVVRDTRDDPFLTTRGSYGTLELRLFADALASQSSFVKGFFQASRTRPFAGKHSWAVALRLGFAEPYGGSTRVPISERFFAGGDATLRGFERDGVGPRTSGAPTGGEALWLFNQEWRFPLRGRLRGVLFYDGGNVYPTLDDLDPLDLRHVLGLGLRLETPIGPVRLEYGRKLDREPDESSGELFLAIGSAF